MGRDSFATHISKSHGICNPFSREIQHLQSSSLRFHLLLLLSSSNNGFLNPILEIHRHHRHHRQPQRSHHEACSFHPLPLSQASPLFFVLPLVEAAFTVPTLQVSNLALALVPAGNCLKIRKLRRVLMQLKGT
ncbi:uncharacterized protein LOC103929076 isoform X2 [Pyrus x bretschneideri]|uniref:uncharacterized protein LOC103929076 isoform X2 n=1 Tax=Pyrus x bretschneideri TaxID=225117 RepID=UPI00203095CF|nr:uncharacterized protein LOC103929076 isoform X2 [Pyrus x bretschneideri]